jgi:hypothetical protein
MFRYPSLLFKFAIVAAMVAPTAAVEAAGNPSASGHGNAVVDGELRTFSFAAVVHEDGTTTGQAVVISRSQGVRMRLEIVCLKVIGSRAYSGAYITNSDDPSLVGLPAIFAVEDNGEGAGSPGDLMTLVLPGDPTDVPDCHDPFLVELLDSELTVAITGGNI